MYKGLSCGCLKSSTQLNEWKFISISDEQQNTPDKGEIKQR